MFKYLIFACFLAFAAAKPSLIAPAVTYTAPLTYSGAYPYAYTAGGYAAPYTYSAPWSYSGYRPLAYSSLLV